ncbi:MAG: hypothetical protein EXS17_02905 [Phycisphaerales bacterium]|nr:hypothetical protein [Phycisphaerales bacterium]
MKPIYLLPSLFVAAALVGCGDSTAVPKPPTPVATNNAAAPDARAPQRPAAVLADASKRAAPANPTGIASTAQIPQPTPSVDAAAQKVSSADSDAKIVEIAGFVMPKPAIWQWQSPSMQFRALQYAVPGIGESGAAEVVFSVFAAGDGGPIDMNIKRWASQFRNEDGSEAIAKLQERTVAGMPVKWIELAGRYQGMGQAAPRPNMMQLGAILQAPDRTVFMRLVGPAATVEAARSDFEAMVGGVQEAK